MKTLLILIAALFASIGVALLIREDPGYVLVTVGQFTVESTVAVLTVGLAVLFAATYILVRFLVRIVRLPGDAKRANARRRERKSHLLLSNGMGQLMEGRWREAEQALLKSTRYSRTPVLGYIGAAQAAHQLKEPAKRDRYLQDAKKETGSATVAVGLKQAELQLSSGQPNEAAKTLEVLHRQYPRHPQVLRSLMESHLALKDWRGLWLILPDLKRRRILPGDEFSALERETFRELLGQEAKSDDRKALEKAWRGMPKHLRNDPDIVADYAGYLEGHDAAAEAERLLRKTIETNWHPKLVLAYGEIARGDGSAQMKTVEGWLKSRSKDPDLLLTAGRIARRNRSWGKARDYYEASVALRPTTDAYHELGSLLEQLDEPEKARDCYRNGLRLLTGKELSTTSTVLEFKPIEEPPQDTDEKAQQEPPGEDPSQLTKKSDQAKVAGQP